MAKATNLRDRPHARIYAHWRQYPAWRALALVSRALLVEILLEYRPGLNGHLEWSCRKAAQAIGVSKDRAARALTQLELLGWLKVERIAKFGRRNAPARYALTMFANDVTGDPPSFAFEHIDPDDLMLDRFRVAPQGQHGRISGTAASQSRDMKRAREPHPISRTPSNPPNLHGNRGSSTMAFQNISRSIHRVKIY
jgi:hypothetical protein